MHAIVRADRLDDVTAILLAPLAPDGRILKSFRHLYTPQSFTAVRKRMSRPQERRQPRPATMNKSSSKARRAIFGEQSPEPRLQAGDVCALRKTRIQRESIYGERKK
jgi:hypothetical protein